MMIKIYAELNKCFKRYFKNSKTLGAFDIEWESIFRAAQVKNLSASVDLVMKLGKLSETLSFKFFKIIFRWTPKRNKKWY